MRWALVLLVAAGCKDRPAAIATKLPPPAPVPVPAPGDSGSAASPRTDLGGLAASIVVPPGGTVELDTVAERDRDGLAYRAPVAHVRAGHTLELTTAAELGWVPSSADADLADNARRDRPFAVTERRDAPDGTWAVVYAWDREQCFLHGWSPAARVWCGSELKVPCAERAALIDACLSLEPAGARATPEPDVALTFPKLVDHKAADAAFAVARAVVRNDHDMLLAVVAPKLLLKGKRVSRDALRELVGHDTIAHTFDIDCKPPQGSLAVSCPWTSSDTGESGTFEVLASDAYGVVPTLTFTRDSGGTWRLTKVDVIDQGEP